MRRHWIVAAALFTIGCGGSALTKPEAAALLPKAIEATLQKQLPALVYCMTAASGFTFSNMSQLDLVATFQNLQDKKTLYEPLAAGLIRIELQEFPFNPSRPSPDPSCDTLHAESKRGGYTSGQMRLAVVRTKPTEKATAAGLPSGTPIDVATRELVDVTSITPNRDGSTSVKYTWRWKATKIGEAMSVAAGTPSEATARFRRVDGAWRVEDSGVTK